MVFRNDIEARRGETLYVDLLDTEDGFAWIMTKRSLATHHYAWLEVTKLVRALHACGVLTARGLEITSEVWAGIEVVDDMPWPEMHLLNRQVLERTLSARIASASASDDVHLVLERWTYPLTGLDLRVDKVKLEKLQEVRARENRRLLRDYL